MHREIKKILDKKFIDNNSENDEEVKKVIILNLQELRDLIKDRKIKISNVAKHQKWANKMKKQINLLKIILNMTTIKEEEKKEINKLLDEIETSIDNKTIIL